MSQPLCLPLPPSTRGEESRALLAPSRTVPRKGKGSIPRSYPRSPRARHRRLPRERRAGPAAGDRDEAAVFEPTDVWRPRSAPGGQDARTHQQVGAAIISLRHRLRDAVSVTAGYLPVRPPTETHTATTARGNAPQAAYIGRPPFPTAPATLAPHWTDRAHASRKPDQPKLSAWLEIGVKGDRGRAGPRGRGHGVPNQRPGIARRPAQGCRKRFNGRCRGRGPSVVPPLWLLRCLWAALCPALAAEESHWKMGYSESDAAPPEVEGGGAGLRHFISSWPRGGWDPFHLRPGALSRRLSRLAPICDP